jgi:hypothetical protein
MPDSLLPTLDKLPRHAYTFLWADYVELLCLCNSNGLVSRGNLQAQVQESEDTQNDFTEAEEDGDEDHLTDAGETLHDKVSARWDDIHARLSTRELTFPGWPFKLEPNVLRSRFSPQNEAHRLYVALLIASSLRLCHPSRCPEVTAAFEDISFQWLRHSLTQLWDVRMFGAHQTMSGTYQGTLHQKFQALANDIQGKLVKDPSDYDSRNTGDGRIDLVAWQKMGDQRGNIPIIFGQCACSPTDWESKQLDVTPAAIEAHIYAQHPGAAFCFVPHDLSASDRKWQRAHEVKRTVLIDRFRLLHLFQTLDSWKVLPKWSFVDEAIHTCTTVAT